MSLVENADFAGAVENSHELRELRMMRKLLDEWMHEFDMHYQIFGCSIRIKNTDVRRLFDHVQRMNRMLGPA
jgi:hypothetical protein